MEPTMNITIRTIPHDKHRYPTIGDWQFVERGGEEVLQIDVSNMGDWRLECLIALHELVEVLLCKEAGITQEQVDKFDMDFEANRKPGDLFEPGYADDAPYRTQHLIAEGIEKIVAAGLGVNWAKYEKKCDSLFPEDS